MRVAILAGLASSLVTFRGPLIRELVARGNEVHAVAPSFDPDSSRWLGEHGVEFHEIGLSRTGLSVAADLKTLTELVKVMRRIKPDHVIAYTIKPVVYGLIAARFVGVKRRHALITGLGYAFTDGAFSVKRRIVQFVAGSLYRVSLRHATTVMFQNADDRTCFQSKGIIKSSERTAIINGSGVDLDHYRQVPLPVEARFLMVARLIADKGIVEYVEAARKVKRRLPDAEFHLVGPRDPNPAALPDGLVERAVSEGVLSFHGEVKDVRPYIEAASVFVLPSYREGTPRSVLEAMSMGRPVITTDAPGCRATTVDGVNGLLVPARSVDGLVDAMMLLGQSPERRASFGAAGRARATEHYEAGAVARSILEVCGL